jgi:hypothetical protein
MNFSNVAAIALVGVLVILAVFQIALAAGAPLGRLAWGGQNRVLPTRMRIGSVASVAVYAVMALVALDRSGLIDLVPDLVSGVAMWVIFGYLVLSIVPNLLSKSPPERAVMAPVTALLAVLALLIALG